MIQISINIVGLVLSVFLGSLLLSTKKLHRPVALFHGALLLIFAVCIFNSVRILVWGTDYLLESEIVSNFLLLLVGPLLYLVVKYEISKSKWNNKDYIHFAPFLVLFSAALISKLAFPPRIFQILELGAALFFVISISCYLFYALYKSTQNRSKLNQPSFFALLGFTLIWHINLVIQSLEYFTELVGEDAQIWATLLLSFLILALSYSHWVSILQDVKAIPGKLNIKPEKHREILDKINGTLTSSKPYLNQNYSLQQLSQSVDEPSSYVSKVINNEMGVSFPKYIARLRVEEFSRIAHLKENRHLTIMGIAEKVGFKSSSTFNKSFKEHMGMLPSAFIKGDSISKE